MTVPAVHVPNEPVRLLRAERPQEVVGNPQLRAAWTEEVSGCYLPALMGRMLNGAVLGKEVMGVSDDNRSAILPQHRFVIGDKEFLLCVKGCGAQFDAFAHQRITLPMLREICRDPAVQASLPSGPEATRFITSERWYGCAPYGAQAPDNAMLALLASMRGQGDSIAGFRICPVVAAVRLPREAERLASSMYWYRRYEGSYWQEVRLMPSNVRVYFQSPVAFGTDTEVAFSMFGLRSRQQCEAFLENLCRSSLAALTLYARTLREDGKGGYLGLDLNDVWLDKDAVVAADGALHFADLEGLEDVRSASREEARQRMRWQCFRHIYEVSFALEAAAAQADRFLALGQDREDRRGWLMDLMRRASRLDGYARAEPRGGGLWLAVRPAVDEDELAVDLEIFSEVI